MVDAQAALTLDVLLKSFNPAILAELDEQSEKSVLTFPYPLNGAEHAYRGWYHMGGTTKSRWCPRQSVHGGPRPGGPHVGADLWSGDSTSIVAVANGTIEYNPRDDPNGWGNHIYLYFKHQGTTYIAVYAHLHEDSAFPNPKVVQAGVLIGKPGCSGNAGSNGQCQRSYKCHNKIAIEDHLHFEVIVAATAKRLDPVAFFGLTVRHGNDNTCSECGSQEQLR